MATLTELIENVVSMRKLIGVYLGVPRLNTRQQAALQTDMKRLDKNLAALAAYVAAEPAARMAAAADDPNVTTVVVTDSYFTEGAANDPTEYLHGGTATGNPNGVSFTMARAVAWWKFVIARGLNVSHVRPTLLPGSKVLSEDGLAIAKALATSGANFAPEDFNPLGLEVVP